MSEKEWRDRIFKSLDKIELKVEKIDKEMTTLKVKVAIFSSIVSSIATLLVDKFLSK